MSATLKLTHKTIGVEVRRGTYDVEVDGHRVASVDMNDTIETPVAPGHHTLQIATDGTRAERRPSMRPKTKLLPFDAPVSRSCRSFSRPSSPPAWH
jgi:hypothetical protein